MISGLSISPLGSYIIGAISGLFVLQLIFVYLPTQIVQPKEELKLTIVGRFTTERVFDAEFAWYLPIIAAAVQVYG